ncbi:MAG TPA: MotA/TolQ/ExbB proton channel family protein [Candidatus Didemnitutus sp.]|jgi:biopolymer transport protein ExbB/TolQ
MRGLLELFARGGPVMIAIALLSVVLYTGCFRLLLRLRRERIRLRSDPVARMVPAPALRRQRQAVREAFQQQRTALGAMIAAAPLLGLLGTVNGMTKTFDSLAEHGGQKSMEGLARGISEVLVATESGLAVAIPALLLVYLAQRSVQRQLQRLNEMETSLPGGGQP